MKHLTTAGLASRQHERQNLHHAYQDSGFEYFFAGNLDAPANMPAGAMSGHTRNQKTVMRQT